MGVLDRRVVLVTGKGGVGKTLVATLLALRAARSGKKTLLCETFGARRVPSLFGKESQGYAPIPLAPSLSTLSITSEASIEEYLVRVLRFRAEAWQTYFGNPAYLSLVERRFGAQERANVEAMAAVRLRRRLLGD
jgi:anion-transporting  ArsA/GET3 family ATPase